MAVFTHFPAPPLGTFVEHFWLLDRHVTENAKYRLFPDGGIEIMFSLGEPQWLFEPNRNLPRCFRTSWASGMRTRSIVISHGPIASMIGARFRPAGACRFLKTPMTELADCVIELDNLWGLDASRARDRLAAATTPQACFAELERVLLEKLVEPSREERMTTWIVEQLQVRPHLDVSSLSRRLGISQKQLQRSFRTVVGVRPKAFARIQRFQTVIQEVGDDPTVNWARVAAVCGYYDQPHFIREFKEFTELTPTSYLSKRGPYLNSVATD